MTESTGCLLCGSELEYASQAEPARCAFCGGSFETTARCSQGHFVCDACHALPAADLIERTCGESSLDNPLELARQLMRAPALKMHGPEHHFLVPAVLVSCASRALGQDGELRTRLAEARRRAQTVPGGSCGFHGACGAGVGAGIFAALMTGSTPLAGEPWQQSNRLTSQALARIADHGGPRCCKRCTTLALLEGVRFAAEVLGVTLPVDEHPLCEFDERNRQCLEAGCPFYDPDRPRVQPG